MRPLLDESDPRANIVLVSILGLAPDDREKSIETIADRLAGAGEFPVFLTDDSDFSALIRARHFYEYLPPIEDQLQHAAGRRWDLYIAEKVRIILAKWRPRRVESPGIAVQDFIKAVAAAHSDASHSA